MATTLIALAQLLAVVAAQSSAEASITSITSITSRATLLTTGSPSSTKSASGGPETHTVQAGAGGFKFTPNETRAAVGDTVVFEFYPPDHSVARAEFGSPCVPYEDTGKDKVGFWSEVQWVKTVKDLTYFNITINDTKPIFYYCTAPGSCLDQIMIGAINPNEEQTLEKQAQAAREATLQLAPGQEIPPEATGALSKPGSTPTSAPNNSPSQGAGGNGGNGGHHGLSGGAIAGIVVGGVAFVAICAALFFFVGRTKSLKEVLDRRDATVSKTTPGAGPGTPGDFGNPGTPGQAYFSPTQQQTEFGNLPPYAQHQVTDSHPSGWASPPMHPGHMSMQSMNSQPPMAEVKHAHAPAEMPSPGPTQQHFTAELEAPLKSPRG
ncbi:hypothetical protein K469DRAFT_730212 [Zopfia rhizophila CBS 207.26]|uniref:Extracellular serine-rich protein n=1 Tax=Zopfia rhizophila CBS 207.26 TaxID=1314779 RepID=A0A6A6DRE0_9PEZI|nr:hypothetical protein K469DRAFT_730212 [Zopfia rhizophila CBS 207.26]